MFCIISKNIKKVRGVCTAPMVMTLSLHKACCTPHKPSKWVIEKMKCFHRTAEQICQSKLFILSLNSFKHFSISGWSVHLFISLYVHSVSPLLINLFTYSILYSFIQIFDLSSICPCILFFDSFPSLSTQSIFYSYAKSAEKRGADEMVQH